MYCSMRQLACCFGLVLFLFSNARAADAEYVIHISVDGLAPRCLETLLAEGKVPTFARLQKEGAWTHNARTDFDYTITLPNHTCMVTGRPVKDRSADPAAFPSPHLGQARTTDQARP